MDSILFAGVFEDLLNKSIYNLARWRVRSRHAGLRAFSLNPLCVTVIKCKTLSGHNVKDVNCRPFVKGRWASTGLAHVPPSVLVQVAPEWGPCSSHCVRAQGRHQAPLFFLEPRRLGWNGCSVPSLAGTSASGSPADLHKTSPLLGAGDGLTAGPVQSHSRAPFSGIQSLPQVP